MTKGDGMKYLGDGYHDHQRQVGQSMTRKINEDVSSGYKSARAGHLAWVARQAGVRTPEQVEDAWLTVGCWLGVGLIGVILLAWAWVR